MRIIKPTFFLIVLLMLFALNAQAQRCGGGFASFNVTSDSTGKVVPKVTIEIIANFYEEDYLELLKKHKEGRVLNENQPSFRVPEQAVSETIKQSIPLEREKDNCGHPLKLVSKVENGVERNFGFCYSEGDDNLYLLKISAPDYITTYYIGDYLGGCSPGRKFVISKKESIKNKRHRHRAKNNLNIKSLGKIKSANRNA